MRTDTELRNDIVAELNWDPGIRDEDIAIAVKDGVVTLAGTIDSYAQRCTAERLLERVAGVRAVVNDLTVKLPGAMARSDTEIAHAALEALRWNTVTPNERIRVRVSLGWLTLEGAVDRYYQKEAAGQAVRYLAGVKGLSNLLTLKASAAPTDLEQRIRTSFRRLAECDADQIEAHIDGSRIMLRGTVSSMAERRNVERVAWNAPGVTWVENALVVSPLVGAVL